jgi:TetR/AcrR family transcriptional regulator
MAKAPKKNDHGNTRDTILDASERIFCEKGFAETSMSQIAKAGAVTKSLIHHHFGSKENLWYQVKQRRFKEYSKIQLGLLTDPSPDATNLRDSLIQYFRFLEDNPEFVRLMSWSLIEKANPEQNLEDRISKLGIDKLRQAQEKGHIRPDVDPLSVLVAVYCLVLHWFQAKHLYLRWAGRDPDSPEADEKYLDGILKIFFEGVLPGKE